MAGPKLHIIVLTGEDVLDDQGQEFDLSSFGGIVPSAGDWILKPEDAPGGDRPLREVRQVWEVVRRFFRAMDLGGEFVVLIVRERQAKLSESSVL